jgi:hypothetical protein
LNISLLVLQSQINSPITDEQYIDNLKKLENEYHIKINILHKTKVEVAIIDLVHDNLFAYTSHRIYRTIGAFSISQVINDDFKPNYVFSNIHVNIQNPSDLLNQNAHRLLTT